MQVLRTELLIKFIFSVCKHPVLLRHAFVAVAIYLYFLDSQTIA